MATITNDNKNTAITISNSSKVSAGDTWEKADYTWDEAGLNTWDVQRVSLTRDSKNSASVTNESKN